MAHRDAQTSSPEMFVPEELPATQETLPLRTESPQSILVTEEERAKLVQSLEKLREQERELTARTSLFEAYIKSLTSGQTIGQAPQTTRPTTMRPQPFPSNLSTASVRAPNFTRESTNEIRQNAIAQDYPKSYIREVLDLIPRYDGHNISIWKFAKSCRRARESLPLTNEAYLVTLIRNKLESHAYLAIEDEYHITIDELLDSLKRVFGPGKSSNYYRGQLSINFMKPNDHILDYIGKIKDLRTNIIEGDQDVLGRTLTASEINAIDSFVFESFYEGLPPSYRSEMRPEDCNTLASLYAKAISASKRLERDCARYERSSWKPNFKEYNKNMPRNRDRNENHFDNHINRFNNTRASRPTNGSSQYNNTNLDSSNKSENKRIYDPYKDKPPNSSNSSKPVTHSGPALLSPHGDVLGVKICSYCKRMGHLISQCYKREYNERVRNESKPQPFPPRVNLMRRSRDSSYERKKCQDSGNASQGASEGARRDPQNDCERRENASEAPPRPSTSCVDP